MCDTAFIEQGSNDKSTKNFKIYFSMALRAYWGKSLKPMGFSDFVDDMS